MGMPQIIIQFRTAGETALKRSTRGQVILMVKGSARESVGFSRMEQASAVIENQRERMLLQLCFMGNPNKVWLERYPEGQEAEALAGCAKRAEGGWLCAPDMTAETVTAFVAQSRGQGAAVRAVVSTGGSPDQEGVVNLAVTGLKVTLDGVEKTVAAAEYCARVAGILAGLSLRQSATYYSLPEVTAFVPSADPEGDIERGRLIVDQAAEGARLGRAVTSKVSERESGDRMFRKIKIVEGVDLIRKDIRTVFEQEYVGKVLNDYDSKLLLVTAINSYFSGLTGSVFDTGRRNRASIDYEAQKRWLESQGIDTEDMSDTAILSANTGSQVFLKASVRFADAMEDLTFDITM